MGSAVWNDRQLQAGQSWRKWRAAFQPALSWHLNGTLWPMLQKGKEGELASTGRVFKCQYQGLAVHGTSTQRIKDRHWAIQGHRVSNAYSPMQSHLLLPQPCYSYCKVLHNFLISCGECCCYLVWKEHLICWPLVILREHPRGISNSISCKVKVASQKVG